MNLYDVLVNAMKQYLKDTPPKQYVTHKVITTALGAFQIFVVSKKFPRVAKWMTRWFVFSHAVDTIAYVVAQNTEYLDYDEDYREEYTGEFVPNSYNLVVNKFVPNTEESK